MNTKLITLTTPLAVGAFMFISPAVRAGCYAPSSVGVYCSSDNYEPYYPSYEMDLSPSPFHVMPSTVQPSNQEGFPLSRPELQRERTHFSDGSPYVQDGYSFIPVEVSASPGGYVNVRSGPGHQYNILDTVADNTELSITGFGWGIGSDRWIQLANGSWMNANYLIPPSALSPTDPDVGLIQKMLSGTL